jgi:hypothetical protein
MSEPFDHRRPMIRTLHVAVLWSFAVAQPLFDVLARDATFFVVRRSQPIDLVLMAFSTVLVAPLALSLIPLVLHLIWKPLGSFAHLLLIALLGAIVVLPPLWRGLDTSAEALLALAGLGGLITLVVYSRMTWMRTFITVMSPAPILFLAAFLLTPSIRKVVSPPETEIVSAAEGATADLVMLVLDELPLDSLLDAEGQINGDLFPGFARLAARTTWLRNASASHESTTWVVPSLLTGRLPGDEDDLPIAHDHPRSLFTLLGDSHDMNVIETITDVCPRSLSGETAGGQPLGVRLRSLGNDLALVLTHVIAPPDLVTHLPSITGNWGSFWRDVTNQRDRANEVRRFLANLDSGASSEQPGLHFLHVLLPHIPYAYLPSGRQYTHPDAVVDPHEFGTWPEQPWWSSQALQRYMLQLGMVDGLIDELLDRMDETGLSESAVLVVTADHGASFRPGGDRRRANEENLSDLLYVPLFVGRPGQRVGLVYDRNVESIDLLPTIADMLEIELPWRVDGVSAFKKQADPRPDKTLERRAGEPLTIGGGLPDSRPLRDRMAALFGEPVTWAGIHSMGSRRYLAGSALSELVVAGQSPHRVVISGTGARPVVSFAENSLPAYLAGRILASSDRAAPGEVTVAVNGEIVATVPVLPGEAAGAGEGLVFTAMIPERVFVEGRNTITLLERDDSGRWWQLGDNSWSLSVTPNGIETVLAGDELALPVDRVRVRGALDQAEVAHGMLRLSGWAIDLTDGEPADHVLVFVDSECVFAGSTGHARSDADAISTAGAASRAGFELELPLSLVGDLDAAPLRLFAVTADAAAELTYADAARWVSQAQHHLEDGLLVGSDGSLRTPRIGPLDGVLDTALIEDGRLNLLGWAADIETGRNADQLLVLVDGRQIYAGRVWLERPSLADDLGNPALDHAGFHHKLPLEWFDGAPDGQVQVFAVLGEHAVELRPTDAARWVTPQPPGSARFVDPRDPVDVSWSLTAADDPDGRARLQASDGSDTELIPWSLSGALDSAQDDGETLRLMGWAVDRERGQPVDRIVVLLDGEHVAALEPWQERTDVATTLDDEGLLVCGFQLDLPREALPLELRGHLSVLVVSDAVAMELSLGAGALWLSPLAPEQDMPLAHAANGAAAASLDPADLSLTDEGFLDASGRRWSFSTDGLDGAVDSANLEDGRLVLHGWAANEALQRPADQVVVLLDGQPVAVVAPTVERPDLVSAFQAPGLLGAGFTATLSLAGEAAGRVAVYLLSDSGARRLRSSEAAAWIDAER